MKAFCLVIPSLYGWYGYKWVAQVTLNAYERHSIWSLAVLSSLLQTFRINSNKANCLACDPRGRASLLSDVLLKCDRKGLRQTRKAEMLNSFQINPKMGVVTCFWCFLTHAQSIITWRHRQVDNRSGLLVYLGKQHQQRVVQRLYAHNSST